MNEDDDNFYELDPVADPINHPRHPNYGGNKYGADLAIAEFTFEYEITDKIACAEAIDTLNKIIAADDDEYAASEAKKLLSIYGGLE